MSNASPLRSCLTSRSINCGLRNHTANSGVPQLDCLLVPMLTAQPVEARRRTPSLLIAVVWLRPIRRFLCSTDQYAPSDLITALTVFQTIMRSDNSDQFST